MKKRRNAIIMVLPLLVLTLIACETEPLFNSGNPNSYPTFTPHPLGAINLVPDYSSAQATLVAGQNTIMEMSHQATTVSLSEDQAADAAAQVIIDSNLRQLMELSIRGTEVSQNMAKAAATQQFIDDQIQAVWNATANAQSQAATATYSAYALNVTQTAQSQMNLAIQATQAAQANQTQIAHSLTATPWAAMQSEITRMRDESERRSLWDEFVVTPLKVFLITLVVILLIVGTVLAYQRLMPVLELRLRTISHNNKILLLLGDGKREVFDTPHRHLGQEEFRGSNQHHLPIDETPLVETAGPLEPSVTNWITEAELKLRSDGWVQ